MAQWLYRDSEVGFSTLGTPHSHWLGVIGGEIPHNPGRLFLVRTPAEPICCQRCSRWGQRLPSGPGGPGGLSRSGGWLLHHEHLWNSNPHPRFRGPGG